MLKILMSNRKWGFMSRKLNWDGTVEIKEAHLCRLMSTLKFSTLKSLPILLYH